MKLICQIRQTYKEVLINIPTTSLVCDIFYFQLLSQPLFIQWLAVLTKYVGNSSDISRRTGKHTKYFMIQKMYT